MAASIEDYLSPDTLVRLGKFELRARMIVEGLRSGMHRSPYHGISIEFSEHRQYVQGDDIRFLDWKVYGRSDKLYLKQYEQETNQDVVLLVDSSGSMKYSTLKRKSKEKGKVKGEGEGEGAGERGGTGDSNNVMWTKFDHATAIAAGLAYLTMQQRDRAGLVIFADEIRMLVNRSSAQDQWRKIVSALSTHAVDTETNVGRCVDRMLAKITNRVLFVIISDLFDEPELIRSALARVRHNGHDAILFHVMDHQEMYFNFRMPAPFEGMENEGLLNLDPMAIRAAYIQELAAHCQAVNSAARGFGFDYIQVDSHEPLGPVLSQFLARRAARQKAKGGI